MAICEIIDATINGKPTIKRAGGIWVIENDDHITTRFLLVWDSSEYGSFDNQSINSGNVNLSEGPLVSGEATDSKFPIVVNHRGLSSALTTLVA
eukprot:COSAG05_NODE_4364_length_1549_cov_44.082759_1_plen_93_part_10